MRKPTGILGSLAKKTKQKATVGATTAIYTAMWGEKPKRGRPKKKQG